MIRQFLSKLIASAEERAQHKLAVRPLGLYHAACEAAKVGEFAVAIGLFRKGYFESSKKLALRDDIARKEFGKLWTLMGTFAIRNMGYAARTVREDLEHGASFDQGMTALEFEGGQAMNLLERVNQAAPIARRIQFEVGPIPNELLAQLHRHFA